MVVVEINMNEITDIPSGSDFGTRTFDLVTLVTDKGLNASKLPPKFYIGSKGNDLRCYARNTLTFVAEGYITRIEFTYSRKDSSQQLTPSVGNISSDLKTWTGETNSVLFMLGDSGQLRFSKIVVYVQGTSSASIDFWSEAREVVAETFFHDLVNIFKREDVLRNYFGEVIPGLLPIELNVSCNIEVVNQSLSRSEAGMTQEKTLRISMPKDAFVPSMDEQYVIQIVNARIAIDTDSAWWHTESVQEGQISIVLTCKLGKTV